MHLNSEIQLCLIIASKKTPKQNNQYLFHKKCLEWSVECFECKTKTILASIEKYILAWPWSHREIEQCKCHAHSRHRRGQARREHMRSHLRRHALPAENCLCQMDKSISLPSHRPNCCDWKPCMNTTCKRCTQNDHSDYHWCQCERQWHFANNSLKWSSCQRSDWKPKVWHLTAHASNRAISEGPNQLPWSQLNGLILNFEVIFFISLACSKTGICCTSNLGMKF